jgi:hypothetical protein
MIPTLSFCAQRTIIASPTGCMSRSTPSTPRRLLQDWAIDTQFSVFSAPGLKQSPSVRRRTVWTIGLFPETLDDK